MSKFVLTFRSQRNRTPDAEQETAWADWFHSIGATIADPGNRVGDAIPLGNCGTDTALAGYTVVTADDLDAAEALAEGCPGLKHGGGVEVGAVIQMG